MNINIDGRTKQEIWRNLTEMQQDPYKVEHTFPATLSNVDRKYVHEVSCVMFVLMVCFPDISTQYVIDLIGRHIFVGNATIIINEPQQASDTRDKEQARDKGQGQGAGTNIRKSTPT